jgi:hypothetical protein
MMPSDKGAVSAPAKFESSLERDFFVLLEFNIDVLRWDAQPLRLDLGPGAGSYVPDVLVTYRVPPSLGDGTYRVLYEVKYRDELRNKWLELKSRYRSGLRYAKAQDWRFKLITEREIRTELLWNAKFLLPYRHDPLPEEDELQLLERLETLGDCTPLELLKACSSDRLTQARLLTGLWHLVASRRIGTDLRARLTMKSRIWLDV